MADFLALNNSRLSTVTDKNFLTASQQLDFLVKRKIGNFKNMTNDGFLSNKNLLFIRGIANPDQIREILNLITRECQDLLINLGAKSVSTGYHLSVKMCKGDPKNINSRLSGVAYAWIYDTRVFNIIIGLNPDGSQRMEVLEVEDDYSGDPFALRKTTSWADMQKEVYLESLIKLGKFNKFKFDEGQRAMLQLSKDITYGEVDIEPLKISKDCFEGEIPGNLVAANVNTNLPNSAIRSAITNIIPGISTSNAVARRRIGNLFEESSYPVIESTAESKGTKLVTIRFDPETNDHRFAIFMLRLFEMKYNDKKYMLFFNQALTKKGMVELKTKRAELKES